MRHLAPLLALALLCACAIFTSGATAEERLAEAHDILATAVELGPMLVDAGKIKQDELDAAVAFLETAAELYAASLVADDVEQRAAARAATVRGILRLFALLADAGVETTPPPSPGTSPAPESGAPG